MDKLTGSAEEVASKVDKMKRKLRQTFAATKFGADVIMVCAAASPGSGEEHKGRDPAGAEDRQADDRHAEDRGAAKGRERERERERRRAAAPQSDDAENAAGGGAELPLANAVPPPTGTFDRCAWHVTSRYVTSCHFTSRYVTLCHVTSRHVMACGGALIGAVWRSGGPGADLGADVECVRARPRCLGPLPICRWAGGVGGGGGGWRALSNPFSRSHAHSH